MALPEASALSLDPLLLALIGLVAGTAGLLQHRSPVGVDPGRRWALAGATALLVGIWLSPLATLAQHYLVSAHLLQLLVLMGPVPALLLLSLPRDPRLTAPASVRRLARIVVNPVFAIVAVNAAFFGWHLTTPFDAALAHGWLYDVMEASLLLASLLFWWPIVTPFSPPVRALSGFGKLGYIVLATIPQTFGGLVVALAGRVLYPGYGHGPAAVGFDPMTDQQIAGASIALVSKIALLAAFSIVFMRLLNSGPDEIDGDDDDGGGGGNRPKVDAPRPEPSRVPRWLTDVEEGRTVDEPVSPRRVSEPAVSGPRPG